MELKVNKSEWDGLSNDERSRISAIISSYFRDTTITPDTSVTKSKEAIDKPRVQAFNFTNPFCTAACGIAEAAAVAACSVLSGGTAIAICVAAAHVAGDLCRSRC
jgi:hypothetical protein